jgi:Uma2 family endonuclease
MSIETRAPELTIPRLPVHRFTIAEYHQMIEAGILNEDENVELLEGLIVPKMSRKPPHDGVLGMLDDDIRSILPKKWKVRIQCAITTADSEPEPDIALVRGPLSRYFARHPQPADVGVVVEVSDITLDTDRAVKGPIYATAGIPYYWIVNIVAQMIEIYSDPVNGKYQSRKDYGKGEEAPLILDRQQLGTIPVQNIFAGL